MILGIHLNYFNPSLQKLTNEKPSSTASYCNWSQKSMGRKIDGSKKWMNRFQKNRWERKIGESVALACWRPEANHASESNLARRWGSSDEPGSVQWLPPASPKSPVWGRIRCRERLRRRMTPARERTDPVAWATRHGRGRNRA